MIAKQSVESHVGQSLFSASLITSGLGILLSLIKSIFHWEFKNGDKLEFLQKGKLVIEFFSFNY